MLNTAKFSVSPIDSLYFTNISLVLFAPRLIIVHTNVHVDCCIDESLSDTQLAFRNTIYTA